MSRKFTSLSHSIPSVFLFLLIGMFAVSALLLTLIGTQVYRSVTDAAVGNVDSQMVLSYLCNKVRAFDAEGGVSLTEHNGIPVLSLYEDVDGQPYETSIYLYQGTMRESFMPAGNPFIPENGEVLIEVSALEFRFVFKHLLEGYCDHAKRRHAYLAYGATRRFRLGGVRYDRKPSKP